MPMKKLLEVMDAPPTFSHIRDHAEILTQEAKYCIVGGAVRMEEGVLSR